MMTHTQLLTTLATALFLLPGCTPGTVSKSLGLTQEGPDEFSVMRRAPLEVNASMLSANTPLPTPMPGSPRPQETSANIRAQQALTGLKPSRATNVYTTPDSQFLQHTQSHTADPDIRRLLNQEKNKHAQATLVERLLGRDTENQKAVLHAEEEAQRLQAIKDAQHDKQSQ